MNAKEWFGQERRSAKKRVAILKLAETTRLTAATKLRKKAAQAVQEVLPATRDQLEQVLWPLLSRYAERVLDSIAEARLVSNQSSALKYVDWLTSQVIPAVVEDVCTPIVGQYQVALQHVVEVLGEGRWPEQIPETRRALWAMLTEVISGPYTENLDKRLTAHLNGQIDRWEAEVIKKRSGLRQSRTPQNSPVVVNKGGMQRGTGNQDLQTEGIGNERFRPELTTVPPAKAGPVSKADKPAHTTTGERKKSVTGHSAGRKANVEFNRKVASIVARFAPNWRDQLDEVSECLDREQVPLAPSKKWKARGCTTWHDVYDEDREGLTKALQHRLDWVSGHPPA